MATAILYGIAHEVFKNLGSKTLNEMALAWGFKDELEVLQRTINSIKNVLLDAEDKQATSDGFAVRSWLQELTTVVYTADDLFDEFNTIVSCKKLLHGNKVTKEVRAFFSTSNQITFALKLSRKIKSIREKLEAIRQDGADFGLAQRVLQQKSTIARGRDQTYSYVDAEEVIGRDDDKKAILDLLLTSENEHVLEVLPIVGIGGMGKTTLAQLVYNDSQVEEYFELRLWVCVAEDFDIKVIIEKILRSATTTETPELDMEQLVSQMRNKVGGKKYLLVLDDVWEENPNKWEELRALLKIGRKGSKILVTTRSWKVANIMGTFISHELLGLSEKKSWVLFEKMAFKCGEAQQKPHLVKVGKEIVKKCANVPLAIKTFGGLLRSENESTWLSFKDKSLEVMDVLKLSYQHLLSPMKNCFAYCALFPKDYKFEKELLIELWMAEGFIVPDVDGGQNLEDIAEVYFLNLLQRGFFQDVEKNEWGEIIYCKMHDLVHDLAQEEAKAKCKVKKVSETDFGDTTIHLSFTDRLPLSWKIPKEMLNLKLLRTCLYTGRHGSPFICESTLQQVVTKFNHLRVLFLPALEFKSLPDSIGKLIHLRYLNLTMSEIETLPNTITNLYNLQTLNLKYCKNLKTLPANIEKLVNLRILNITECNNLTHMPAGIGGLTSLRKLTMFIVRHKQSIELKKPASIAKLSDLKKLNNLRRIVNSYLQ